MVVVLVVQELPEALVEHVESCWQAGVLEQCFQCIDVFLQIQVEFQSLQGFP